MALSVAYEEYEEVAGNEMDAKRRHRGMHGGHWKRIRLKVSPRRDARRQRATNMALNVAGEGLAEVSRGRYGTKCYLEGRT